MKAIGVYTFDLPWKWKERHIIKSEELRENDRVFEIGDREALIEEIF